MAIVSIKRMWVGNPDIVVIVASSPDTLETVSATGYIASQAANIAAANNGAFFWLQSDQVLINVGGTENNDGHFVGGINYFFQIAPGFASLMTNNPVSNTAVGLTAHAGGGQTNGTLLIPGFNTFTTVATAADSATLPANVQGNTVVVNNASVTSMDIYPALGDTINGGTVNAPITLAGGATVVLFGTTATNWASH